MYLCSLVVATFSKDSSTQALPHVCARTHERGVVHCELCPKWSLITATNRFQHSTWFPSPQSEVLWMTPPHVITTTIKNFKLKIRL
jgi:hypothetical protein